MSDLARGDQFLLACQVLGTSGGTNLALYGPGHARSGSMSVDPSGNLSGTLVGPPSQVPVFVIVSWAPFNIGDVVRSDTSGETMVCRWVGVDPTGAVVWSAAVSHQVIYPVGGWTAIGTATLT